MSVSAASGPPASPSSLGMPGPTVAAPAGPNAPAKIGDDQIGRELDKASKSGSIDDFQHALEDAASTLKTPTLNAYGNMIADAQKSKPDFSKMNDQLQQLNGEPIGQNTMKTLDAGAALVYAASQSKPQSASQPMPQAAAAA